MNPATQGTFKIKIASAIWSPSAERISLHELCFLFSLKTQAMPINAAMPMMLRKMSMSDGAVNALAEASRYINTKTLPLDHLDTARGRARLDL